MNRDDRRGQPKPTPDLAKQGWKKTAVVIAVLAVAAIAVMRFSRHSSPTKLEPTPSANVKLAKLSPRELQETTAKLGVNGGAVAGMKVIAKQQGSEPRVLVMSPNADGLIERPDIELVESDAPRGSDGSFRMRVRSANPYVLGKDKEAAVDDVYREAREKLREHLLQLDSPVRTLPTTGEMRRFKSDDLRVIPPTDTVKEQWKDGGLDDNRAWVEMDFAVGSGEIRQLRSTERLWIAGLMTAALSVVALGLYGFFKLDLWTKGYLTVTLGIVTLLAIAACVAGLIVFGFRV